MQLDTATAVGLATLAISGVVALSNTVGAWVNNRKFDELKGIFSAEFTHFRERLARVETALDLGHRAPPPKSPVRKKGK